MYSMQLRALAARTTSAVAARTALPAARPWTAATLSPLRSFATRIVRPETPPVSPDGKPMSLEIDASAVKQLKKLYASENNDQQALRIIVEAGGCHGFQYKLDLVDATALEPEDVLLENDGAKVVIDDTSLELVSGSKVIFANELIGQEFRLTDNPNAGSSCGCGTSFEVKF
ncbi:[4Fe-4S] proteins maturation [Blastocladiella emersonii ATCC 22665]|nr:[4Fe-4S] proteins maturation [Blastocladiella emersonii ATCC 22665]